MRNTKGREKTKRRVRVRHGILLALLLGCLGPASAEERLPLYYEWGPLHDYFNLGGQDIDPWYLIANASGGYGVRGLDMTGEWIEIQFNLSEAGRYDAEASFKSYDQIPNHLSLSIRPLGGGEAQSADLFYIGLGIE